jgi:hypothetical protein
MNQFFDLEHRGWPNVAGHVKEGLEIIVLFCPGFVAQL